MFVERMSVVSKVPMNLWASHLYIDASPSIACQSLQKSCGSLRLLVIMQCTPAFKSFGNITRYFPQILSQLSILTSVFGSISLEHLDKFLPSNHFSNREILSQIGLIAQCVGVGFRHSCSYLSRNSRLKMILKSVESLKKYSFARF